MSRAARAAQAHRRGINSREWLSRDRLVVERILAWLLGSCRHGVRHERRANLKEGLLQLACSRLGVRFLASSMACGPGLRR